MVNFNLNLSWKEYEVGRSAREELLAQKGGVVWLTGLSGSGKSTIANLLDCQLHKLGYLNYVLDGDKLRSSINKELSFSNEDRLKNITQTAHIASILGDAGVIVIVALISPFESARTEARSIIESMDLPFFEVFVDAPLSVCEARDPKGLYQKVAAGTVSQFTGIDSSYERPTSPDLCILTENSTPEESVEKIVGLISKKGLLLTKSKAKTSINQ